MKETEIGMIPDDWEVKRLGELFSIKHGFGFKSDFFSDENNQKVVVTPGNFKLDGGFQYQNKPIYYTGVYPEEFELASDDLVITMTDLSKNSDTLGNPMLIPKDGFVYLHNQRIGLVKILGSNCNKSFLFRLLCSKDYHHKVVSTAAGSTVKHTSPKRIYDVAVPLPPTLAEQQKIAKALSDVDNVISTLEKLITKKKNLKQGTMQQLLTGKKRLPGFGPAVVEPVETTKFKQTEIGEIPKDWEVKSFEELFDICTSTISLNFVKTAFYVGTENMLPNRGGVLNNENELNYLSVREYRKEDILFSNIRPYLKKLWLANHNGGCSTDVLVFRKKNKDDSALFLYMLISDDRFFQIVNDNAIGTKMPRGDKNIIKQIKFCLPSKLEQTAIANVLSSMDKEIEALNTKLEKYRNLKTGMMQQLLTGKIRLV